MNQGIRRKTYKDGGISFMMKIILIVAVIAVAYVVYKKFVKSR
jgi:hypothetical protein